MSQIKIEITGIEKLECKSKIVEEKEDGMVVDRELITEVKFQAEFGPEKMRDVMWALRSGKSVSVIFSCPQLELGLDVTAKEAKVAAEV